MDDLTEHQRETLRRVRAAAPESVVLHLSAARPLIERGLIREVEAASLSVHHAAFVAA